MTESLRFSTPSFSAMTRVLFLAFQSLCHVGGTGKTSGVGGAASFVFYQMIQEMFPHFLIKVPALCRFSVDILYWLRIFPST